MCLLLCSVGQRYILRNFVKCQFESVTLAIASLFQEKRERSRNFVLMVLNFVSFVAVLGIHCFCCKVTIMANLSSVVAKLLKDYRESTPKRLKIIDAYLFYVLLTGIIQFAYCCLVGTFPFNSFLSGFISCVGCFTLGGEILELVLTKSKYSSTISSTVLSTSVSF